ncbi:nuclear transport factor 2 family protein [Nocardia sp. NPDC052254]|uniref:YybH family protein n=1 Tax=Nocardia sp. NPDC052254 TaxID=3155681 RepID=UPI0034235BE6
MKTQNSFREHGDTVNAEEAAIRRRLDTLTDGLRAKDLEALRQGYTTDVVSFDVEPPLQHAGVAAKLDNWAKVFRIFHEVDYEFRDLRVTVGADVAFAHGFGRLRGTLGDGTVTPGMWVRATFGLRKIDGVWLIAHDQVSVPLDIVGGTGVVDLEP